MATKHKVLQGHLTTWLACKGNKQKRGMLTQHLSTTLKIHTKSIGRSMMRIQLQSRADSTRSGRPRVYGTDVDSALSSIWEIMDYPCAENMTRESIEVYIHHLTRERAWKVPDAVTDKLLYMSEGTKKIRIAKFRTKRGMHSGRSATIASPLKGMIPIRKSHTWHTLPQGYVQTDSVVHCGDLLTGDVLYSVGCVDFRTYWSEYTAQWNKGQESTCTSLQLLRTRIPFRLREIHPDSGNEFINNHVLTWATKEKIAMTRSEPYKKNDNMCIEERNNNIVRTHVGYARLDDVSFVPLVQEILRIACLIQNHFHPVRRMLTKTRVGAKWKRTFEKKALTPYERVLLLKTIPKEKKDALKKIHEALNPLELKRNLDKLKVQLSKKLHYSVTNKRKTQ